MYLPLDTSPHQLDFKMQAAHRIDFINLHKTRTSSYAEPMGNPDFE